MSDTKHWITKLVPTLAFAAGIIIASIGGIITTSSALKLAFFESNPYDYIGGETCRFDYNKQTVAPDYQPYERTPQERFECISTMEQENKARFENSEKQDIVEGVSALIVGGILIFAFRKRD